MSYWDNPYKIYYSVNGNWEEATSIFNVPFSSAWYIVTDDEDEFIFDASSDIAASFCGRSAKDVFADA